MNTICPKCRAVRPADTTAPDWQCPSCGVAYAKAGGAAPVAPRLRSAHTRSDGAGLPWRKVLMVIAIVYGAWAGFNNFKGRSGGGEAISIASRVGGTLSTEQLTALASSNQPSDVMFYTAPWCPYCASAKQWMAQYGFKYEECDIQVRSDCASQLRTMSDGVPYLIVKGHHMKDGFDAHEFIAALKNK